MFGKISSNQISRGGATLLLFAPQTNPPVVSCIALHIALCPLAVLFTLHCIALYCTLHCIAALHSIVLHCILLYAAMHSAPVLQWAQPFGLTTVFYVAFYCKYKNNFTCTMYPLACFCKSLILLPNLN